MPTISIIVPVYNTEKYLPRCLDSILSQSFTDFELLLVDDGSTDGSGTVCDKYAVKDNRVRVFHKENGGVSSARNLGLKEAKGSWICFVDSDDELIQNGLQVMADGVSGGVCMVMSGYQKFEDGKLQEDTGRLGKKYKILERDKALLLMYPNQEWVYMGYSWGKLISREEVVGQGISFNEDITIKEDTLFWVTCLCKSNKAVCFTYSPSYKYFKTRLGAMGALSVSYNRNYLTSFDAVVQMNSLIQKLPNVGKDLSFMAKKEVVDRCYRIYSHMKQHNSVDKCAIRQLRRKAIREVGLGFYIGYKLQRNTLRIQIFFRKKRDIE